MKNRCLNDFFNNLETKSSNNYVKSLKGLINQNNLNVNSLSELIDEEVEK